MINYTIYYFFNVILFMMYRELSRAIWSLKNKITFVLIAIFYPLPSYTTLSSDDSELFYKT